MMMKKRFLLALIATSMSLAGCGKNKQPQEPDTPSGPVDPVDPGDDDKLTPEQQAEANEIKKSIDDYLSYIYDDQSVQACDSYTVAYAEEVAKEDIKAAAFSAGLLELGLIVFSEDYSAIVDFALSHHEDGTLKDVTYGTVAFGKSLLRVAAKSNENYTEQVEFVADYLDDEGLALHKGLYGALDAVAGCVSVFAADEFAEAVGSIYDAEENQISFAALSSVMVQTAEGLAEFAKADPHVFYLVNLVKSGVVEFATEFIEDSEEIVDIIKNLDLGQVVESFFGAVGMGSFVLDFLADEESPVAYVVELVNLGLAEKYDELVSKLVNDALEYLECEFSLDDILKQGGKVGDVAMSIYEELNGEEFKALLDEVMELEEEDAVKAKLHEVVAKFAEVLEGILDAHEPFEKLLSYAIELAEKVLVASGKYSEEEVDEMFDNADAKAIVNYWFDCIEDAIDFVKGVGEAEGDEYKVEYDAAYNIIKAYKDGGDSIALVATVFSNIVDVLYTELQLEAVDADTFKGSVLATLLMGYSIYSFFSEDFIELVKGVVAVDSETGEMSISEDGVRELLSSFSNQVLTYSSLMCNYLVTIVTVIEEIVEKLSEPVEVEESEEEEEEPSIFDQIIALITVAQTYIDSAKEFLSDEESVDSIVAVVSLYGNLVLEGVALLEEFLEGEGVEVYKVVEYAARVASIALEVEPEEFEVTSLDAMSDSVKDAINYEWLEELIDERASTDFVGERKYGFELVQEEESYQLVVSLVSSYEIVLVEGEVTSVSVVGQSYTFDLPAELVDQFMSLELPTDALLLE